MLGTIHTYLNRNDGRSVSISGITIRSYADETSIREQLSYGLVRESEIIDSTRRANGRVNAAEMLELISEVRAVLTELRDEGEARRLRFHYRFSWGRRPNESPKRPFEYFFGDSIRIGTYYFLTENAERVKRDIADAILVPLPRVAWRNGANQFGPDCKSVLWILLKSGFTKREAYEIADLANRSKGYPSLVRTGRKP